ncbi:MAG TPA: hypothetical protein VGN17_31270 [Bryobacteraceae bacterium]
MKTEDDKSAPQSVAIPIVNSPKTQDSSSNPKGNSPTDRWVALATIIIAGATVAQAVIYWRQKNLMIDALTETKKASDAAIDNAKAAKEAAFIAAKTLVETRRSVTVSEVNAATASKSLDIMIAKERARLRIRIQTPSPDMPFTEGNLNWSITNHGLSTAQITRATACLLYVDKEDPIDYSQYSEVPYEEFLDSPLRPEGVLRAKVPILPHPGPDGMEKLISGKASLWIHASVEYEDAFGRWLSKRRMRLVILPDWVAERRYCEWIKDPESENQET